MAMRAFSLVELSVVLIILGLLTGGILAGQSLIRAAEIRTITQDVEQIQSALKAFRDQYRSLPGDMPNATDLWGIAGGTTGNDNACYTVESSDKRTCNGNDDELINSGYSSTTFAERGRAWQHLANAGLIEGQYTGYMYPFATETRIGGQNAKASMLKGTHWNLAWVGPNATPTRYYTTVGFHSLELTKDIRGSEVRRDLLTPQEAWNIDVKLDDGKPSTGNVVGAKKDYSYAPNCTTSTNADTAEYNLTVSSKECFPEFMLYWLKR